MNRPATGPAAAGRPPRCAQCGYDLTGRGEAARCPECGHPLDDMDSRRTLERTFFRRAGWLLALGTIFALGTIVVIVVTMGDRAALFAVPLVLLLLGWLPFALVARLGRHID